MKLLKYKFIFLIMSSRFLESINQKKIKNLKNKIKELKKTNDINNNLNISFKDEELQNNFNLTKIFYKNLLTEYFRFFKKNNNSFFDKKQKAQFVKLIYNKDDKKINDILFIQIIFMLFNISKKKKVIIDFQKNVIKEIEYKNNDKFININIETIGNLMALNELLNKKKITEEEFVLFSKQILEYKIFEENQIIEINRNMEFKNLIINNMNFNNQIINDVVYVNLINSFVDENSFTEEEKIKIKNYLWVFIEFLNSIYEEYFDYLNNKEENFTTEVEILKKVINFREKNTFISPLVIKDIYLLIKHLFPSKKIEKINNIPYILKFIDGNDYSETEITNLESYNKLEIVYNSLYTVFFLLTTQNQLNFNKNYIPIEKIYLNLLKPILKSNTIKNI
jgi:hypothetical protein